jgi:hypothetical protein
MRKVVVPLLALTLFAPSACSGSGGDSADVPPQEEVAPDTSPLAQLMATAADKVSAARTYRFEGVLVYPVGKGTYDTSATGAADTGSGGAVGEARVEPFTTMELDLSRAPLAGMRGGVNRMIVDGPTFYLRFPDGPTPGTGMGPGGRLWGKFELETLGQAGEGFRLLLERGRSAGPSRSLALLTRARRVAEAGMEKIRDVDTRHFTMTANVEEVADNASSQFAAGAQDLLDTIGGVTVNVDVWLGPDDLPRRITYSVDPALRRDLSRASVDLYDYGAPVERTVPPAAETFDFTAVAGS